MRGRGVLLAVLVAMMLIPICPPVVRSAVGPPAPPASSVPDFRAVRGGWLLHGDRVFISDPTHSNPPTRTEK